jgi:ribokinase
MSQVIVIGSSNTDMVIRTSHFPVPGETILGGEFFMFSGGKGANQAVAAARMGASVLFAGRVGNDIFGQRAVAELSKEGIGTGAVQRDDTNASGTAVILVDEKGENEIVVAPGANNTVTSADIDRVLPHVNKESIVLLQLEIPLVAVVYAVQKVAEKGARVIINPAPAQALPAELFSWLYLITPNETEAQLLTGITVTDRDSAKKASAVLLAAGVRQVIITMGAQGAFYTDGTLDLMVSTPLVKAVDSTAAGDTFNGVLATALLEGKPWEAAISYACRAAALSVTRMGAQASMPYRAELADWMVE